MNGLLDAPQTIAAESEEQMLDDIIDAMLDAQTQLSRTESVAEWTRILVDSCRRRRGSTPPVLETSC